MAYFSYGEYSNLLFRVTNYIVAKYRVSKNAICTLNCIMYIAQLWLNNALLSRLLLTTKSNTSSIMTLAFSVSVAQENMSVNLLP